MTLSQSPSTHIVFYIKRLRSFSNSFSLFSKTIIYVIIARFGKLKTFKTITKTLSKKLTNNLDKTLTHRQRKEVSISKTSFEFKILHFSPSLGWCVKYLNCFDWTFPIATTSYNDFVAINDCATVKLSSRLHYWPHCVGVVALEIEDNSFCWKWVSILKSTNYVNISVFQKYWTVSWQWNWQVSHTCPFLIFQKCNWWVPSTWCTRFTTYDKEPQTCLVSCCGKLSSQIQCIEWCPWTVYKFVTVTFNCRNCVCTCWKAIESIVGKFRLM